MLIPEGGNPPVATIVRELQSDSLIISEIINSDIRYQSEYTELFEIDWEKLSKLRLEYDIKKKRDELLILESRL